MIKSRIVFKEIHIKLIDIYSTIQIKDKQNFKFSKKKL
jgi:hypothetical protein